MPGGPSSKNCPRGICSIRIGCHRCGDRGLCRMDLRSHRGSRGGRGLVYAIHDRDSWDDPRRRGLNLRPATPFYLMAPRVEWRSGLSNCRTGDETQAISGIYGVPPKTPSGRPSAIVVAGARPLSLSAWPRSAPRGGPGTARRCAPV